MSTPGWTARAEGSRVIALRPYQLEAVGAVEEAGRRGARRVLVALPTGTGKTLVFVEVIRRRGGRSCVLAHRDELIEQAVAKIRLVHPDAEIGVVKAERDEHDAQVVVASVQTLSRPRRLARIARDFSTVVVDEAHHSTAKTYERILRALGCLDEAGPLTLGVTATPERHDRAPLGSIWHPEIVYRQSLLDMIRAGYLCDLRALRVHIEADLDRVRTRAGDLVAGELEEVLQAADAPDRVVEAYLTHAADRKALLFTPTIAFAHAMADALREAGVEAEALDGSTPIDERRAILRRLHSGETRVVANCAVLTEGFDEPSIDCIIMARPTKSRPLYTQMLGRGTRIHPGKRDCLILDLVAATRHRLVTIERLSTEWPEALTVDEGESVMEAIDRQGREREAADARGRMVARVVDLFGTHQLNWIALDDLRYVLSVGDGQLVMASSDHATWTAVHQPRTGPSIVVAECLDLGYAQGAAEDYVRQLGAARLADRNAPWRARPASEKQLVALRRWKVPYTPPLTKGAASDLLDRAIAYARRTA